MHVIMEVCCICKVQAEKYVFAFPCSDLSRGAHLSTLVVIKQLICSFKWALSQGSLN